MGETLKQKENLQVYQLNIQIQHFDEKNEEMFLNKGYVKKQRSDIL
jgi:hypothetical protein